MKFKIVDNHLLLINDENTKIFAEAEIEELTEQQKEDLNYFFGEIEQNVFRDFF